MNDFIISDVLDKQITALVIAMGSNHNANSSFTIALTALCELGHVRCSSVVVGRDFTGRTSDEYHNACAVLNLDHPQSVDDIHGQLKHIERLCGRELGGSSVPMDLDILAVFDGTDWLVSQKRLPFKAHERAGLSEVATFLLEIK
ncbi:MAG: 2-amino-4-hydroxy-6-hydroxymethyldihydropteridine diphosphokinase [Moraxella sp.]|nr:2-amino-4-hydroxy-6-hydroxymethyldihydropteridine diphosphokinase [Moraxella sp.]